VEGARLLRLAGWRVVRDGGRLLLQSLPPAILVGKVSRMCLEMMSLHPAGLSAMSERMRLPVCRAARPSALPAAFALEKN